jgi:hypothetical protein
MKAKALSDRQVIPTWENYHFYVLIGDVDRPCFAAVGTFGSPERMSRP